MKTHWIGYEFFALKEAICLTIIYHARNQILHNVIELPFPPIPTFGMQEIRNRKPIEAVHTSTFEKKCIPMLTHWGRVTHICVSKLTIIGSYNGLSPDRRQAIIWTNAGLLSIGPIRTYLSENFIFQTTFSNAFSWMKMSTFRLICHWSLFPRVQLTIFQLWFR